MTESPRVDAALPPVPTGTHPWVAQWTDRIGFGVSIFPQPPDWQGFIRLVQRMEAMGIDSYWSYDHPAANADCWTALAALAVSTERIRLGTMVDCIYYRPAYLLARQAADVDRASGGRLVLGLGIGRLEEEFAVMGLSFPPTPIRQRALEETFAILRGLWSGEPFSYRGDTFSAATPGPWGPFLPPVQEPYVPFLLAGGGEKTTLRQVARFADASNMGAHPAIGQAVSNEDIARKFDTLKSWCNEYGRPVREHPAHALHHAAGARPDTGRAGDEAGEDTNRHARLVRRCPLRRHTARGHHVLPRACRAWVPVLHHQPPWR